MLKDLTQRERKTIVSFELRFYYDRNGGFGFPCNADGIVNKENLMEAAKKKLEWCKAHPEKFAQFNEVVAIRQTVIEPAHGTCVCGEVVILEDRYYGACQCPQCGRWYNLFGEELLPPDQWGNEEDPAEEEVY